MTTQPAQPIEVFSYDELISRIHELEPLQPNGILCYRGQVRNYDHMVPSMVRRVDSAEFDLKETVYLREFWFSVAEKITVEHFPDGSWGPAITHAARTVMAEGILQHYGFQTHFIDVTLDLNIALCFAHYEYRDLFPVLDGNDESKLRRVACYAPSLEDYGYIYVLDCQRWHPRQGRPRHGEVIDLTNLVRPGWNRVQMQRAMVVHSDAREAKYGGLRPYVRASFRIPLPLPGCDLALEESRMWFPGPKDDPIYKTLLESRFVEQVYIADRPIRYWRRLTTDTDCLYFEAEHHAYRELKLLRRTLDIPEYHDNPESVQEIAYLRSLDKVLKPTFFFDWLRHTVGSLKRWGWASRPPVRAADAAALRKVAQGEAILVLAPFSALQYVVEGRPTYTRYPPERPALNLFFEFSPYNFSGPFADDRAIRGIWIAGDSDRLEVAVLGSADERPWISEVSVFNWIDGNYQADAPREPALRPYLALALRLLNDIDEKRAEVLPTPGSDCYRQMRYAINLDLED
jgi:hypothetical protein